ncbi:zinc ribbon domain-containing protein [Thermoleophilia bacterium SCSIO 60948]|nr:zinc ribbon domain-containing protein [Thermoleophilia bacterium SCSIO 60948]
MSVHATWGRGKADYRSHSGAASTIAAVPIYEFRCPACGAQSESLEPTGTEAIRCPACGEADAGRVLSSFSPSPKLALSGGNKRRQEAANRRLHAKTKADFKAARRRKRDRGPGGTA